MRWYYDKATGKREENSLGTPVPRTGPPPCAVCPKVPQGIPNPGPGCAVELGERGQQAWDHYTACKAVGDFPKDGAVKYIAGVIARAEAECERQREDLRFLQLAQAVMVGGLKKV